jgi:predicted PurR-regulated permease PerM
MSNNRPGCLVGFFKLFLLDKVYDWLQKRFGFGRKSCVGVGCGLILLIIMIVVAVSILSGTDWLHLF